MTPKRHPLTSRTAARRGVRALVSRKALPRAAAQALTSRSRFLDNIAGMTFRGRRDLYKALGFDRTITPQMYRSRYRRNGVAARIVEAKPKATWRGGAEVVENDQPKQTPFELAWEALEKRLTIWSMFLRADVLAGLGRYSILLLGTPGEMETPLETLAADDLVYLTPFSEEDAQIEQFDTNITSRRFGLPQFYAIRRLSPSGPSSWTNTPETVGRRVHYTRVIHVADGLLDDHVYGLPRLERVWNDLDNLEKITGGGAEAFWKRADQGLVLNLDPTIQIKQDAAGKFPELEALKEQVDEYEHDLRRVLTTRGVKVDVLGSAVAEFSQSVASVMSLISAASEIPQRILMGSEQAKLASTQDADNWDERILDRRSEFAAPQIVLPFVHRLIALGALPAPVDHLEVKWPEIKNLNENQKADIAGKWAALNTSAGERVVTGDEIRGHCLELDPLPDTTTGGTLVLPKPSDFGQRTLPRAALLSRRAKGKERSSWAHVHETADRFSR